MVENQPPVDFWILGFTPHALYRLSILPILVQKKKSLTTGSYCVVRAVLELSTKTRISSHLQSAGTADLHELPHPTEPFVFVASTVSMTQSPLTFRETESGKSLPSVLFSSLRY